MGRHRRSAAGRAATSRATGVTQTHGSYAERHTPQDSHPDGPETMGIAPYLHQEAYADSVARSQDYLYATEFATSSSTAGFAADEDYARADTVMFASDGFAPDGGTRRDGPDGPGAGRRRRKKKGVTPVKTGLLGVSAAVALGTVAVATGVVPGLDSYKLGGGNAGDNVQAAGSPTNSASEQGGTSGSADAERGGTSTSRDAGRSTSPSASPSPSASTASASPTETETETEKPEATPSKEPETTPAASKTAAKAPAAESESPVTVSAEAQAAAEVLKLVNEERAKVGCSAVSANSSLADLAEKFSDDMAARGFFDHTDPDGATPWDRAAKAGISDLGGENIARGQADAAAVMEAWMNSPGHKANILNCDFKTLGVGVHLGSGGPWWTQDFGY
ncbi:CAP domain-containing protein [Streptomyces sp. NBC_01275]|uniref:CAP domain-containing protein n=1 Tax=Streptomyces sp. NBC_01275 TaxID=2903807 RepID=UPI00225130C8|nr:CAP domain-containing protein [Streptomyces sp. NBC_01275]MCX4765258.1 CAP domain-containing protein [Streptomyces sp. NBC_01275]